MTASTDCNVSMWTLKGAHIGIFGKTDSWSLTNTGNWLNTKEHSVDRYVTKGKGKGKKGRGGVLNDGDGDDGGGELGGRGKNSSNGGENGNSSSSSEEDEKTMLQTLNRKRRMSGNDEFNKYREKSKTKEMRRFMKKAYPKYQNEVKNAEKILERYYYAYAKAKLEKKISMHAQVRINGNSAAAAANTSKNVWGDGKSLLMQNLLWDQRWGKGLSIEKKEEGGESDEFKRELENTLSTKLQERMKQKQKKMEVLRAGYVHVAHNLHVHSVSDVENCRGHALVQERKGEKKKTRGDRWLGF